MFQSFDQVIRHIENFHVEMVDLKFCDLWGRWHHLTVPAKQFAPDLMEKGIGFDGSAVGLKSVKAGDMVLVPDLTTGFMDPFWDSQTLSFLCKTLEADTHAIFENDPRNIAIRAEEFLKSSGIGDESRWGPEYEFYIFDSISYEYGVNRASYAITSGEADWNSAAGGHGHYIPLHGGYHAIPPKDSLYKLRTEIVRNLDAIGVPVKYHHHEVGGPGQSEIETPMMGLVRAGDATMIIKYVTKMTAHTHGQTATFMPKPLYGEAGSGMHFHQHLFSKGQKYFLRCQWIRLSFAGSIILYRWSPDAWTCAPGTYQPQHQFISPAHPGFRSAGQCLLFTWKPERGGADSQVCEPAGHCPDGVSSAGCELQCLPGASRDAPGRPGWNPQENGPHSCRVWSHRPERFCLDR